MTERVPAAAEPPLILQLCPNDHPPFRDICAVYQQAGESLGCRVMTVFFGEPRAEPLAGASYLGIAQSSDSSALTRALRRLAADFERMPLLVVCHRYRALRTFIASRLRAHRVVVVAHEFRLLARWQRRLARRLFARDVIFAGVSPAVTDELAAVVPGAVCLPNAIDLPLLDRSLLSRADARAALGLPEAGFTVAVSGRLIPWKRPQLALEALEYLDGDRPVHLVLLGEGPLRGVLAEKAAGLPVTLAGFQPDARRLLRAFDALLMVSEDREAFGMVALEAMAAGVPVIAPPAPGPRFVLGEDAVYYPRADGAAVAAALDELRDLHQRGETEALIARARKRAERHFSVAALAAKLDTLFFTQR